MAAPTLQREADQRGAAAPAEYHSAAYWEGRAVATGASAFEWVAEPTPAMVAVLADLLRAKAAASCGTLLELGCGTSDLAPRLARALGARRAVCVDASATVCARMQARPERKTAR